MTPKEALNELCDLATPNGDCLNYVIGLSGIILKALDSLELLKEKAKKYDEILNLKTTPNVIEKSLADFMNKCIALEKENQELKEYFDQIASGDTIINLFRDNAKLKKVIDILKKHFDFELDKKLSHEEIYPLVYRDVGNYRRAIPITQQEYELIKEFLENV